MSRIDELLRELAPRGVAHRPLGAVGEFVRGNGLQKSDLTESGFPAIHYGQVHTHYGVSTSTTRSYTAAEKAAKLRRARSGDLVIATTSEDDEAVGKATAWLGAGEVAVSGDAYIYRHTLEPRFVAYFFKSEQFRAQKAPYLTGTKVRRISGESLSKIVIPVPPLEVQLEIVRILDHFTALEEELEAELKKRQEFARVTFRAQTGRSEAVPGRKRRVREFARQNVQPVRIESDGEYVNLGVKWYGEGVFAREAKSGARIAAKTLYRVKSGQFIYNRMFVTEGSFGTVPQKLEHGVVSNEFPVFDIDSSVVLPEWLHLYFRDPFVVAQVARQAVGGTKSRRRWKEEQFLDFEIEVPVLKEQERVVTFAKSLDELSSNLKAELAARRGQHTYYRNKLLTFEEAPA